MTVRILQGDCRDVLKTLPDESVHCVVTSPPYWGLRDYGMEDQIGHEDAPAAYVAELVGVFREARRVLRGDGTLWLNLGDTYAANRGYQVAHLKRGGPAAANAGAAGGRGMSADAMGLKTKDLAGIPWMVAFALRADGWWLRQDIIWAKKGGMPESVTDRCTKNHEYIFLLSKKEFYYFDHAAIREPVSSATVERLSQQVDQQAGSDRVPGKTNGTMKAVGDMDQRNKRSVWHVSPIPFTEAHFATFPPKLIEPCILAGCPEGGTVLDPFGGAGTTGLVADRRGRNAILVELNPAYADIARKRITADGPLFADVA